MALAKPIQSSFLFSLLALALSLTACGPEDQVANSGQPQVAKSPFRSAPDPTLSGTIQIDGSSTVYPITDAVAREFRTQAKAVKVAVDFSGTGGGFAKFCAGKTDINNASRPISQQEMAACKQAGVAYVELPVAFDALTVVVHPQNSWAEKITIPELKKIWEPTAEGNITNWQQVRPSWPDRPLKLYGPGQDSGTFDYFTEVTTGKAGASRSDYVASEDDTVLVQGVSQDPNALGYFGFAYYENNAKQLKALAVDSGEGPVRPSRQTVENAQYQPLSRPLFIYVNSKSAQDKPEVRAFVDLYLNNGQEFVQAAGYIPLPDEGYSLGSVAFHRGEVGTQFAGKAQPNLTIGELLRRQAKY